MSLIKSKKLFMVFAVLFAILVSSTVQSLSLSPYSRYPHSGLRYTTNAFRYGPSAYGRRYGPGNGFGAGLGPGSSWAETGFYPQQGCPVCDSSVYSYCSHKQLHDNCCCGDEYYAGNSFECQYTDCSYIHANSCQESNLITTCCCEDAFRSYNPLYSRFFDKK